MDWHNWCRLCGSYDTISKLDDVVVDLARKLEIGNDNLRACMECHNYLFEVYQFTQRSRTMELMFLEIDAISPLSGFDESFNCEYEKNINSIRHRYGLKAFIDDKAAGLENLFDANIASALEIKIENEMEIPMVESAVDDREYFVEEALEDEGSVDDTFKDESEESVSYEEVEQESGDEELEEKLRTKKKGKKGIGDNDELFDFTCHICKLKCSKMSQLTNHCRKLHDCLPEVICYCGKTLNTLKRLLVHKQKHFPEKFAYECKDCKMVYKMKTSYVNHMKSKHGPDAKVHVCSQCARTFKDSRTLIAHEKTHLPTELKTIYSCDACDKKFVNKNSLKSHVMSVHEMSTSFTCETCGKSFSTKSNLKSHLYSHTTEKNVQCDVCSARFKNMDSLRKHKKTHLEKTFECNICHNRYRNRNNLKAHMVVHSDVKPFQCTFCPNQYKRSKDLKCHLNLHTGERPHVCQFCNRTFINGSNCRKHKLKDHPEELAAFEAMHGRGKSAAIALQQLKTS